MAFMTTATTELAVVGAGRLPEEPATSRWEYFRGFWLFSMCLSNPDT